MGKQEIEFIIKPDGTVEEKVTGVNGPDCEEITRDIEQALGKVEERKHTGDFFGQGQGTSDTVSTSS